MNLHMTCQRQSCTYFQAGATALVAAAEGGQLEIVELLLKAWRGHGCHDMYHQYQTTDGHVYHLATKTFGFENTGLQLWAEAGANVNHAPWQVLYAIFSI